MLTHHRWELHSQPVCHFHFLLDDPIADDGNTFVSDLTGGRHDRHIGSDLKMFDGIGILQPYAYRSYALPPKEIEITVEVFGQQARMNRPVASERL